LHHFCLVLHTPKLAPLQPACTLQHEHSLHHQAHGILHQPSAAVGDWLNI
jgi:hypothetical protein